MTFKLDQAELGQAIAAYVAAKYFPNDGDRYDYKINFIIMVNRGGDNPIVSAEVTHVEKKDGG